MKRLKSAGVERLIVGRTSTLGLTITRAEAISDRSSFVALFRCGLEISRWFVYLHLHVGS